MAFQGACVAQSVKHLPLAQVIISRSWDQTPHWAPCSVESHWSAGPAVRPDACPQPTTGAAVRLVCVVVLPSPWCRSHFGVILAPRWGCLYTARPVALLLIGSSQGCIGIGRPAGEQEQGPSNGVAPRAALKNSCCRAGRRGSAETRR